NDLARRLDILRTSFVEQAPEPLQRVSPTPDPRQIQLVTDDAAGPADLARYLAAEARLPDPALGPNVRFMLVRTGGEALLVATASPLCADRTTLALLAAEACSGRRLVDELQYPDLAQWLRSRSPSPV